MMDVQAELDAKRARWAAEVSTDLDKTGISVKGGGSNGPYSVTVDRLTEDDVRRLVEAILQEMVQWESQ